MLYKKVQAPDSPLYQVVPWSPEYLVFSSIEADAKLIAKVSAPTTPLPTLDQLFLKISAAAMKPWNLQKALLDGKDLELSTEDIKSAHVERYVGHECVYLVAVLRDQSHISEVWLPIANGRTIAEDLSEPLQVEAKAYINPAYPEGVTRAFIKDGLTNLHFNHGVGALRGTILYSRAEI